MTEIAWKWSKRNRGWVTKVALPRLAAWHNAWSVFYGRIDGPSDREDAADRTIQVVAMAPEEGARPDAPSPAQSAALARLSADEAALAEALAEYLFQVMRDGQLGQIVPEPGDAENADEFRIYERLHCQEGMRELFHLEGVEILPDDEDGLAHLVFAFASGLDEEHGTSVCAHGTRVLSHGGLGDQGGWPPPSEEDMAAMAAMLGSRGTVGDPRARLRQVLEAALADPANGNGIRELTRAALALIDDPTQHLELTVRIDTPPVTRVEKIYYGKAGKLSYDLTLPLGQEYVIYKDSMTPRQAGLNNAPWPLTLFAAQCKWPAAQPQWDTVRVRRVDQAKSQRKGKTMGPELPELQSAAVEAWREGFDPAKLAARNWRLPPDPMDDPGEADPTPQEQALGAGMHQGMQALRALLGGQAPGAAPPDLAALLAGVAGTDSPMGLMARTMAEVNLVQIPASAWAWSDPARGSAAARALTGAGLQLVGHFHVVIPFAPMFVAYVDPGRRFYALIYDDLYNNLVSVACCSLYEDGGVYEVTTRAASATGPLPAWKRVVVLPAQTEAALVLERFLADRPAEGLRPADAQRFAADFKEVQRRQ
jgi:hypothetical protein